MRPPRPARIGQTVAIAVIALTVVFGVLLRLEETMVSEVIPAEDPFTHMALVRSHLADGTLDPLTEGGRLYPPGMHAILAAVWVYSGIPLEDIFRFGPVVFGGIGVLGVGLLLWRCHGPTAAVIGSLAMALAPELAFRTTMMSPTAVDLAVVPFFFYAVLETLRGRLAWSGIAAALAIFFVLAHPWVLAVLAPTTLGMVVVWLLVGGRAARSGSMNAVGAASVLLSLAGALAIAIFTCWSQCGFGQQSASTTSQRVDDLAGTAALVSVAAAALLIVLRRKIARLQDRPRGIHWSLRAILAAAILGAIFAVTIPAQDIGMPKHVNLPRMIGWPIMGLGIVGMVAAPFMRSRAAFAGASLVTVTYPFVIYNVLDSQFWPHRTAAYLGIGLAIMAGVGASAIVRCVSWLARAAAREWRHKGQRSPAAVAARGAYLAGVAGLIATFSMAGTVYADTPLTYETGWYRMYPECEYDGLRELAREADKDTIIVTGDWRPKLVMAAFTDHSENVWYDRSFFTDQEHRDDTVIGLELSGRDVVVVVDRHMKLEHPDADTSFLYGEPWQEMGPWCEGGAPGERLNAYTNRGAGW